MTDVLARNKTLPRIARNKKNNQKAKAGICKPDPWADWGPQWRVSSKQKPGVYDLQERHAPTVEINDPERAEKTGIRRRIVDARLWGGMTGPQQKSAIQIVAAFEAMARGLGRVTSDWNRVPGSSGAALSDGQSRYLDLYMDWATACQKRKISHAMIMDILAWGKSCRAVDRERRQRAGAARVNLISGLNLYAALQGWR